MQTKSHQIATYKINKISLWYFDQKKYILDGIKSLAYEHKDINLVFDSINISTVSEAPLLPYHLLCNTCVTYRTSCHAIDQQVLSNSLPEAFLGLKVQP